MSRNWLSLWNAASSVGHLAARRLCGTEATVAVGDLVRGSIFSGRLGEFRGRSVLVATEDQLSAALALLELDGIARRLVLYPPDLSLQYAASVGAEADVDAIVTDNRAPQLAAVPVWLVVICNSIVDSSGPERRISHETEWILLTSGTTGRPKMVVHTLQSLAGAIDATALPDGIVWSTFYDIRRYGGIQIFLRAILGGATLVLSSPKESISDFLTRSGAHQVTHISGTPSHWRGALMTPAARSIAPRYVRLSGEIADQSILDNLRTFYPEATVAHAFATTEAGVAFEVRDGLAGFPASFIEGSNGGVDMKVEGGSLRIRSNRIAAHYLSTDSAHNAARRGGESGIRVTTPSRAGRCALKTASLPLTDPDGFIDTGDLVELRGDRYFFVGRKDGVINVGGLKVHPEEVEAVVNSHPQVRMSLVRTRKSPFTGAIVVADVLLKTQNETNSEWTRQIETEILQLCREGLPPHKAPAAIRFVPSLPVAPSGKLERRHA